MRSSAAELIVSQTAHIFVAVERTTRFAQIVITAKHSATAVATCF